MAGRLHELQLGMSCGGDADHLRRKIDPEPESWPQGGQQVRFPTTNFQDSLARADETLKHGLKAAMVMRSPATMAPDAASHIIPVGPPLGLKFLEGHSPLKLQDLGEFKGRHSAVVPKAAQSVCSNRPAGIEMAHACPAERGASRDSRSKLLAPACHVEAQRKRDEGGKARHPGKVEPTPKRGQNLGVTRGMDLFRPIPQPPKQGRSQGVRNGKADDGRAVGCQDSVDLTTGPIQIGEVFENTQTNHSVEFALGVRQIMNVSDSKSRLDTKLVEHSPNPPNLFVPIQAVQPARPPRELREENPATVADLQDPIHAISS